MMMTKLPKSLTIRNSQPSDHQRIISVMRDWWEGRDLTWMLPKLFLVHFCNTSFIIEEGDSLTAFLIGFLSQSKINEGYIHLVGVHPNYRGMGIGAYLYQRFFEICKKFNRDTVRSCTSRVNKGSIEFHKKIGFNILKGDTEVDDVQASLDYNQPGDSKVLFEIQLITKRPFMNGH
jgi:GNAT superfamily N-acetyltransferase